MCVNNHHNVNSFLHRHFLEHTFNNTNTVDRQVIVTLKRSISCHVMLNKVHHKIRLKVWITLIIIKISTINFTLKRYRHFLQAEQGLSLRKVRSVNNVDIDQLYLETIHFLQRHAEQGRRSPRWGEAKKTSTGTSRLRRPDATSSWAKTERKKLKLK